LAEFFWSFEKNSVYDRNKNLAAKVTGGAQNFPTPLLYLKRRPDLSRCPVNKNVAFKAELSQNELKTGAIDVPGLQKRTFGHQI